MTQLALTANQISDQPPAITSTAGALRAAWQRALPWWRRGLGGLADVVTAARAEDAVAYQVPLAQAAMRCFDRPRGLRFTCVRGALWITLDGEGVDHVLHAGESFEASSRRRVIAYGLEDAVLRVVPAAMPRPLRLVMQAD